LIAPLVFSELSILDCPFGFQEWTIQRKPKGQSRMDNTEKTKGAIKNGQFRENQRGNKKWTIQRKQRGNQE
jgi:hypothetical protein